MTNEQQVVWCIKYALTTGIFELQGHITSDGYFVENSGPGIGYFLGKKDYCLTLEDAKIAAEELRKRKIKSLEKQLAKVMTQQIKIKSSHTIAQGESLVTRGTNG